METALARRAVIAGSHGRITLSGGAAPTQLAIVTTSKPDAYPGAYHGLYVRGPIYSTQHRFLSTSRQHFGSEFALLRTFFPPTYSNQQVPTDETTISYALADPAGLRPGSVREDLGGKPAPDFNYPNTHGFVYQGEAIHRCLAAGLFECPQFTAAESLTCMTILDGIEAALRAQPALPPSPRPEFAGQILAPGLPDVATTAAASRGLAPETPLDIKMGLTSEDDVSHPLRW
jgi:hypothetical protein